MGKLIDMTGERFGKLTVLERSPDVGNGKKPCVKWVCKCDCGNIVVASGSGLRSGHHKTCGRCRKTHPEDHRLYECWFNMKRRCKEPTNKRWSCYGGKGIKICSEWNDFEVFKKWAIENGYQDDLTIDRIDNNGDYCPSNCRWTDRYTQQNNTSRNRYVQVYGETMTMAQAARKLGVTYSAIQHRVQRGMPLEGGYRSYAV